MLKAIFFGFEMGILEELRRVSEVIGVYVKHPKSYPGGSKNPLTVRYRVRTLLRPIINKYPIISPKLSLRLSSYDLYDFVLRNHLRMISATSINAVELRTKVSALCPDIGVVAKFQEIIPRELLSVPRYGFLNFHPSLLPKYRGPHPFAHILLNEEKRSGATWHIMTECVDGGDILAQEEYPIDASDSHIDIVNRSISLGKQMIGSVLRSIEQNRCRPIQQNEEEATYSPRLTSEQRTRLQEICRARLRIRKSA